jgi:hypothetical protein
MLGFGPIAVVQGEWNAFRCVPAVVLRVPGQKSVAMSSESRQCKLGIPLVSCVGGMGDVLEETDLGEASRRNEGDPNRVLLVRG